MIGKMFVMKATLNSVPGGSTVVEMLYCTGAAICLEE
jgi:hypothetical protein